MSGLIRFEPNHHTGNGYNSKPNWRTATTENLSCYQNLTGQLLCKIAIPNHSLACRDPHCTNSDHLSDLHMFYAGIVSSLKQAAGMSTPATKARNLNEVPGWNDQVRDLHNIARDAFKLWIVHSKPRYGPIFDLYISSQIQISLKVL